MYYNNKLSYVFDPQPQRPLYITVLASWSSIRIKSALHSEQ